MDYARARWRSQRVFENSISRDALRYINELFKPDICGEDLKWAILRLKRKTQRETRVAKTSWAIEHYQYIQKKEWQKQSQQLHSSVQSLHI